MEYVNFVVSLPNLTARVLSLEDSENVCKQTVGDKTTTIAVDLPLWTFTVTYDANSDSENLNDAWSRAVGPDMSFDEVVAIKRVETSPPRFQAYVSHRQMECIVRYHMDLCKPGLSQISQADVGKPAKLDDVNTERFEWLQVWSTVYFGPGYPDIRRFFRK